MKFGKRQDPKEVKPPLFAEENEPLSPEMQKEKEKSEIKYSGKHIALRIILFILLLGGGATLVVFSVLGFLSPSSGLQQIKPNNSEEILFAGDYSFFYYLSGNSMEVNAQVKQISGDYSEVALFAYASLDEKNEYATVPSIGKVNLHPNEFVALDEKTFNIIQDAYSYDKTSILQGPLVELWETLIASPTKDNDPSSDMASKSYIEDYAALLAGGKIGLTLDATQKAVRLDLSSETLAWKEEQGYSGPFLHLNQYKNAYAMSYLANALEGKGYRNGYLESSDGVVIRLSDYTSPSLRLYGYHDDATVAFILSMGDYKQYAQVKHFKPCGYVAGEDPALLRSLDIQENGYGPSYVAQSALLGKDEGLVAIKRKAIELARCEGKDEISASISSLGDLTYLYEIVKEEKVLHVSSSLEPLLTINTYSGYTIMKG